MNVLIVEDNEIAMTIERLLMKSLNCEVDGVATGEEAIEIFKKNKYDLILMDIGLPGIDGIEASRQIRLYEKENLHEPTHIVAVTGNAVESQHKLCMEAGMDGVLVKPLTADAARSILSKLAHQ